MKGGEIHDGTGAPGMVGNVAIKNGVITAMGDIDIEDAREVIDAEGLVVSPGFVDLHTHSDFTLVADNRAQSQVHQGVTTEVVGQCGANCAPVCSHDVFRSVSPWYTEDAEHPHGHGFGDCFFPKIQAIVDARELSVQVRTGKKTKFFEDAFYTEPVYVTRTYLVCAENQRN